MKNDKAAGPLGIIAAVLKGSSDAAARLVADLTNDVIRNVPNPSDWENSFIINIYKGKGDALIRDNYRALKFLYHVMKGIGREMEKMIRERVFINGMQFGFMPGRSTTDAISILRQLQKNIWLRTGNYTSLLLTLKRHSMEYQEKVFGGQCENFVLRNGSPSLYRLCATKPDVKLESITPTMINLELKLEFIRVQYLVLSYSSFYSKPCHVSSSLGHPGSFFMLMT